MKMRNDSKITGSQRKYIIVFMDEAEIDLDLWQVGYREETLQELGDPGVAVHKSYGTKYAGCLEQMMKLGTVKSAEWQENKLELTAKWQYDWNQ